MVRDDILSVTGLRVVTRDGDPLVHDVSLAVERGGALGIVGESGSGKSLTCRSILGILPPGLRVDAGTVTFDGIDLTGLDYRSWQGLRGNRISAVFQDPASYLNPSITVGKQLSEVLRVKTGLSRRAAHARSLELFEQMGLREPAHVYRQYPFELSGGMLQRVLIAIALSADPELLIADEATTALDVTVQAEVLDLLEDLRRDRGLTLILVSHDLAVVSQICDHVVVMRDGVVVESGTADDVLKRPQHEYTRSLIEHHTAYGIEKFLAEEVLDV
ncbi:ABC transporter ATP-binding protein [Herbiconiux daphne]|uniref:ABC transporter ATP-binding protein n=1 Tax=Herbiconiux daphne TaxID=2970914 RepID=A0ABT2H2J8_9MICO|nr:ABC transporter ATP-binding protein [Herbiconiux daphne]MCS5734155.1 ABC transporter ATP-binding protein [Herbiconiux daphne]